MMGRVVAGVLVAAVVASAVAVVWMRHEGRKRYVELQAQWSARDEMNIEWGRLQLELGAFATHARVEQVARERLAMRLPQPEQLVIVRP